MEVTDTFTLADIVDFEFDKVYVAGISEVYVVPYKKCVDIPGVIRATDSDVWNNTNHSVYD